MKQRRFKFTCDWVKFVRLFALQMVREGIPVAKYFFNIDILFFVLQKITKEIKKIFAKNYEPTYALLRKDIHSVLFFAAGG